MKRLKLNMEFVYTFSSPCRLKKIKLKGKKPRCMKEKLIFFQRTVFNLGEWCSITRKQFIAEKGHFSLFPAPGG